MTPPLYARAPENILLGSVVSTSGFSVLATYDLATLLTMRPEARVRFDGGSGTISFAIGSPGLPADLLCIPMHNFSPGGSPSVLQVTNDHGLNVSIPIRPVQADSFPPTLIVDLSTLATAGELIFGSLDLVVTNGDDLVLGGAVGLYPKRSFAPLSANTDGAFTGALAETYEPREEEATNEYGSRYVQEYDWTERGLEWSLIGPNAGIVLARDWFLSNHGHARPAPLWPYPDEPDLDLFKPLFGTWQKQLRIEAINTDICSLTAVFSEWPKGQVIA